jgi:predicted nucleic acid-binding protein
MDRAFLDANVLFAVGYRETTPLLGLWNLADVTLLTSAYAIEEARRNLTTAVQRVRLIERIRSLALAVEQAHHLTAAAGSGLPPKDIPILAAAIAGNATHLLTGDVRHFKALLGRTIYGVSIIKPVDYLRLKDPHEPG